MKVSDDPRKEKRLGNFPGSPVAKTLPSNVVCSGGSFDPWSGNKLPHPVQ